MLSVSSKQRGAMPIHSLLNTDASCPRRGSTTSTPSPLFSDGRRSWSSSPVSSVSSGWSGPAEKGEEASGSERRPQQSRDRSPETDGPSALHRLAEVAEKSDPHHQRSFNFNTPPTMTPEISYPQHPAGGVTLPPISIDGHIQESKPTLSGLRVNTDPYSYRSHSPPSVHSPMSPEEYGQHGSHMRFSPPRERREFRPTYQQEEEFFIWYHRVDLGLDWGDVRDAYNRQFPGRQRRGFQGIQCKYYRCCEAHGVPKVRDRNRADQRRRWGLRDVLPQLYYPWMQHRPGQQARHNRGRKL